MNTTEPQPQPQQKQVEEEKKENGNVASPYCGFSPARRLFIIGIVSAAGFLGPLAGGIYLPALPVLEEDFGVGSAAINATVSVFMAVCAFAPLFWSAFADWKGRRPLYIISLAIYLVANILMAALPTSFCALVFLRMAQAFGCSSVISLGAGTIADVRIHFSSTVISLLFCCLSFILCFGCLASFSFCSFDFNFFMICLAQPITCF